MFTIHEHNEEREWMKLKEAHKLHAYEQGHEKGYEQGKIESLHTLMENTGMTEEAARAALGLKQ